MNQIDQKNLLKYITAISFFIDDTVLFLDTHPTNQDALAYLNKYNQLRKEAVHEYTIRFGPLTTYKVDVTDSWTWVESKWPWEGEC